MSQISGLTDPKNGRSALGLRPLVLVLVPVAFIATLPWLKTLGSPMATVITAAVTIFVMGYASYLSFRHERGVDEVYKASTGFAAKWGVPIGQAAFVLLLLLPPFQRATTAAVIEFGGMTVDRTVVVFAMTLGFCGVVLLQGIGTLVVNVMWWKSKQ